MVSFQDFKYFYVIFYIFGLGPYYPLHVKNRIKSKVLMFLPFVLLIANTLFCSLVFLKAENNNLQNSYMILYTLRFTAFVPNFVVIWESLTHPYGVRMMNHRLFFICNFLKAKLKSGFHIYKFKTECVRHFFACFIMLVIANNVRMNILTIYELKTEIAIFIMQAYKTLAILHALFYMSLFKFILVSINDGMLEKDFENVFLSQVILNVECNQSNRISTLSAERLRQIRFIYLKLWEVMKMFNKQVRKLCLE